LTEAFEASQDALDQMGRACALQHHAWRVHIVKDTKLGSSTFESELLAMPLNPNWLFGEGVQEVVDKVRAQKSSQTYLSTNAFSFTTKKGPFRKTGQNNPYGTGSQQQASGSGHNREQSRGGSGNFNSNKPFMNKGKNQFRNRSGSSNGNNKQSGERFKSPLQAVDQPFRA
jgi:hypothetical protein